MSFPIPTEPVASKIQNKFTAVARAVTLVFLLVSLGITKANVQQYDDGDTIYLFSYRYINSYKYVLAAILLTSAYSAIQFPFAVYYAVRGKRLINHHGLLEFDFYGDKVILCILGTATGAYFGATSDLKRTGDRSDSSSEIKSKADDYFNLAYIAAGFLLIGFLSSTVSSVLSSRALYKER